MNPDKLTIDTRIAEAAANAELKAARALGADWIEAYSASWRCLDEVLKLAAAPMPPTVLTRFRTMKGK